MLDWVESQRSVANFDVFLLPQGLDDWGQALENYSHVTN